jgi:large subunit ribosomal protein L22
MAVETKEYRAEAKFQRVSPQKARLVLDLIKGRGVEEALDDGGLHQEAHRPGDSQAVDLGGGQRQVCGRRAGHDLDVDNLYVKRPWPTTDRA